MIRTVKIQIEVGRQCLTARWICGKMAGAAVVAFMLCGLLALDSGFAQALNFKLGEDATLDIDTSLTYSAAWRAKDRDSKLEDQSLGNSNFDKGDMINNRYSALVDMDLQYKDYGFFMRPRAYFDFAYDDSKFFDETKDLHRDKAEILDAFAYGLFEVGEKSVSLRVGKQVASWGESLFILNGISAAMSPIDATAANVPGVELKDLFLPVGQVFLEASLLDNLTVSTFYQWEWDKTRLDETGAYFNTNDLIDDAARNVFGPLRTKDLDPKDDGQWGVALRYVAEELNGTEFGLYYINYHEKLPVLNNIDAAVAAIGAAQMAALDPTNPMLPFLASIAGPYSLKYDEDISLYGASVSGMVGDTNVAFEVSYRQDFSVPVQSLILLDYEKVDVIQAQISTISIMPLTSFYDNKRVTTEFGINNVVDGLDGKKLYNDRTAWGGVVKAQFDYYQILENLDLQIPITYKFNPDGVSSVQGTFSEDADSLGVSLDFTYKSVYKLGLGYVDFLNDADKNDKADRDFYSLNLKYTF